MLPISIFVLMSLSAPAWSACPVPGQFNAVDTSSPVNDSFLTTMSRLGVNTIVRYYDHIPETIRGKTIKRSERNLIARHGFSLIVVFQHASRKLSSFTEERARADSLRSLELANAINQPTGSAIYFGVDNGWSHPKELAVIKLYFRTAAPVLRSEGYKIGAYGSGLVCSELLSDRLVDYCWLANATSWPGHDDFFSSQRWSLKQFPPRKCADRTVDFNLKSQVTNDIGQFN